MENIAELPQQLKTSYKNRTMCSINLSFKHLPSDNEIKTLKTYLHSHVNCNVSHNSPNSHYESLEQLSTHRQMNKMWYIFILKVFIAKKKW